MRTAVLVAAITLPLSALAQSTVPVEDAPFKEAGALAGRIDPSADLGGTYASVPAAQITTDLVSRAEVLDVAGNRIGNASGVLFERGQPVALVFRVGGVFGVFEKPVTIPLLRTDITMSDTGATRIVLDVTADELRGMDRYEGPALAQ